MKKTWPRDGAGEITNKQQQFPKRSVRRPSPQGIEVAIKRLIFELRLKRTQRCRYRRLRALLKSLLRRHGFRCIDAREVGAAMRSAAYDNWVDKALRFAYEDEIVRRNIKLKGMIERFGPCPRCGGNDRFAISTSKQL